jgi:hypothetical protein
VNERLMGEIARQRRLADAIRADKYGIGGILSSIPLKPRAAPAPAAPARPPISLFRSRSGRRAH